MCGRIERKDKDTASIILASQRLKTTFDLRVPFLRTTTGQSCFSYKDGKLWNDFAKKTKNTSTLKDFMKAIK